MGIRGKLLSGFSVVLLLLSVVGWVGWQNTTTFSSEFTNLYTNNLKAAVYLANAERGLWELRFGLPNYLSGDAAAREKIKADTPKWLKVVDENLSAFAALPLTAPEKAVLAEWEQNYRAYAKARPEFFALLDEGKLDEAKKFRAEATNPSAARAVAALAQLNDLQQKIGADKARSVSSTARTSTAVLIGLVSLALALGIAISLLISRAVARPLMRVVDVLESVRDGDFTRRLDIGNRDEVGRMAAALNQAVDAMRTSLLDVSAAADQAALAAQHLSAASGQLSSGAHEQASSLEETATSLEEITGTVKQNADNARQANQLAIGSREVAEKGGQVVADAVQSMDEINRASKKIADIITTIDEIAFQTNLLALNAAVEAARAGEQGRGFAVVASEVRNLAQRSASAAKEIKGLINDSVQKVDAGSALVNRSGETLYEIVTSVKRVTDIIGEIAAASHEQTGGIEQVNRAVTQMDQVVHANASQTEELSATAQSLAGQAEQLQRLVARFKLEGGARARTTIASITAAPSTSSRALAPPSSITSAGARPPRKSRKTDVPVPATVASGHGNGHASQADGFEEF